MKLGSATDRLLSYVAYSIPYVVNNEFQKQYTKCERRYAPYLQNDHSSILSSMSEGSERG